MRSDKLPHFVEHDPPAKNYTPAKVKAREEIKSEIDRFLAQGGVINQVDATANRQPVYIVNDVVRD